MNDMLESIRKNKKGVALMMASATCLCLGQLAWKLMDGMQLLYLISGFVLYGVGALAMLFALRFGSLSVLQPMNSVSYIISTILGALILREAIGVFKILGIIAIIMGVILIAGGDT